jgi:vancomycin resistance protein VanW
MRSFWEFWLFICAVGVLGTLGVIYSGSPAKWRVLSAYATPLTGRTPSQRENAIKACEKLNGALIPPGAVFSFNQRVGTWGRYDGYRRAPVSYGGQLVNAYGGGVCQASSTLYNSALLAGMEILKRHPHQVAPSYVPPGLDAAVAIPNIDLIFRNPHPFPVKIEARAESDRIVVVMWGRGKIPRYLVEPEILSVVGNSEIRVASDRCQLVNPGKSGYWVRVFRRKIDGRVQERELLSTNYYPPVHRVVLTTP